MTGEFKLCHPDGAKSCASCCGLYNYEAFDRATVSAALDFRTGLFRSLKPGPRELEDFRRIIAERDNRPKLLEDIYTCEFMGFVDESRRTVGCLVHPMVTGGLDLRDCAYYGAETCGEHKCSAYNYLSDAEAEPVIAALDDWYLYGQCITDIDLIKEFYREVSDFRCASMDPTKIARSGPALDAFRRYLDFKESWPYRRGRRRFGQYVFDNGRYMVKDIDWKDLGITRPSSHRILRALGSEFDNRAEVEKAQSMIRSLVVEVAESI